jgi:hypothetical protein
LNLTAQISLISNPQEFTRLCNAVLLAEYGTNFLPIDDDRADRGNDGYLKSEKRLLAMHCFKRVQNQSIDREVRTKMIGDLAKAANLKKEGIWEVESWTFVCNYPIPEGVARDVFLAGKGYGIDVSWLGPDFIAEVLQRAKTLRSSFPNLQVSEVMDQLQAITDSLEAARDEPVEEPINWVPRDAEEQRRLISQRPMAWEYLLFAGVLLQGKLALELKWQDYKTGYARRRGSYIDDGETVSFLRGMWVDAEAIMGPIMPMLSDVNQLQAFGAPGKPGNPVLIEHLARRIVTSYEELLDWAEDIRSRVFPERFRQAFALAALVVERPAQDVRNFIDRAVEDLGRLPDLLAQPDHAPIEIELNLTVTIDDAAMEAFSAELERIGEL